jgi:hypothetical protein
VSTLSSSDIVPATLGTRLEDVTAAPHVRKPGKTHAWTVQPGFTDLVWWHPEAAATASPGGGRAVRPAVPGAGGAVPTDARKATVRRFGRSDRRALRQSEGNRLSSARMSRL